MSDVIYFSQVEDVRMFLVDVVCEQETLVV